MNSTVAVIVAGGTGSRMTGSKPKTYRLLNGKPVLWHTLQAFASHYDVDEIVLVHNANHTEYLAPILAEFAQVKAVIGGSTRQQSVRKGLEAIEGASKVLIHDAARPFVSHALISRVIDAKGEAVIPVIPVADTIKRLDGSTVDRSELRAAQTPQAFNYDIILKLHQQAISEVTDDAMLAEQADIDIEFVDGDALNRKITTEDDLKMMQAAPRIAVGNGFDVHAFVPHENQDKNIMICGVPVECDMAIEGHSDGDVGLHALTDAILGCIGNGDIGQHFSSDNPKWKGADSELFLKEAIRLMRETGGKLSHCDITLITQMPKLAPHRENMRARIAEICGVDISYVSVKATTTDYLGFIGRKEGLAAQATATVTL